MTTLVERLRAHQRLLQHTIDDPNPLVVALARDLGMAASRIELAEREAADSRTRRSEIRPKENP